MAQFGPGSQLAAQCPRVPTPDGWRPWTDADGPVPDALVARAASVTEDQTVSLGSTESFPLPGVTALIRVEPRAWTRDTQGNLVEGCFRVGGVYLPASAAQPAGVVAPSSDGSLNRTIGVLTAVSLTVGTVATLATWGHR
jgi:hypothetical protein